MILKELWNLLFGSVFLPLNYVDPRSTGEYDLFINLCKALLFTFFLFLEFAIKARIYSFIKKFTSNKLTSHMTINFYSINWYCFFINILLNIFVVPIVVVCFHWGK